MSRVIYSRSVLNDSGTGAEARVSFEPPCQLGDGYYSYVEIEGTSYDTARVRVDHIHLIKQWLDDVVVADLDYRKLQAREGEKP